MADIDKPEIKDDVERKTLHLNGRDFENLEALPTPVDHVKDKAFQDKFSADKFLGTPSGLQHMLWGDRETVKFNARTNAARMAARINHERRGLPPE